MLQLRECSSTIQPLHHVFEASGTMSVVFLSVLAFLYRSHHAVFAGHLALVNHKYTEAIALYQKAHSQKHVHTPQSFTHIHALQRTRARVCECVAVVCAPARMATTAENTTHIGPAEKLSVQRELPQFVRLSARSAAR
jgi:hypothetical protein